MPCICILIALLFKFDGVLEAPNCCVAFDIRAQSHTSVCSFALNLSALHLNTSKTPYSILFDKDDF